MKTFKKLFEDSQDAGYPSTLETPRELGKLDLELVALNKDQKIGDPLIMANGKELKGSYILQNSEAMLQYTHPEETEFHIESVEVYRNLWNSIHIPLQAAKFIGSLK